MKAFFAEQRIDYTGEQLRSHWARETFGIEGDCIVSFLGSCDVSPEFMVDLLDLAAGARIYSPLMLHFIAEHFERDLGKGVLRQRLLAALTGEYLREESGREIVRRGDDLYLSDKKISISIAAASPVSVLIHLGINVKTDGVPVPACGLEELGLDAEVTAHRVMEAYIEEMSSVDVARTSAKPVK